MTYAITLTNGSTLTEISNGVIDQTHTDLTLIGQNYTGYGTFLNDNFVHLLENFSNTIQPPNPIMGQLWYDTSSNVLKVYNGTNFTPTGNTVVASSAPSGLATGQLFIDSTTSQLYFNDGLETNLAGPIYTKAQGPSGFEVVDVFDVYGTSQTIVKLLVGNTLLGIFSKTAFTPNSPIDQYTSSASIIGTQIGSTLTVTSITSGTLSIGQTLVGTGIAAGTTITEFLLGPGGQGQAQGGVGTYGVSTNANVPSTNITAIYGSIKIGFNVGTYGGIQFNVPTLQANYLLSPAGTLLNSSSFVSASGDSTISNGGLTIQPTATEPALVLGSAGQTQINVNANSTNVFQIQSVFANQDFDITLKTGSTSASALHIIASTQRTGIYTNAPQATLDVNGTFRIASGNAPAHNNSVGVTGQIAWDSGYIYVCTATNTWVRAALSSTSW